jgi:hypothetical protein
VPVSLPEQSKPPQTSRPPAIGLLVLVLIGALVGTVAQELRWRGGFMIPQSHLAQAEQAFQAGDNQAAVTLFSGLADKNNPVAQYWLAHMTELGLGVPRDPAKAIELYKKAAAPLRHFRSPCTNVADESAATFKKARLLPPAAPLLTS